MGAVTRTRAGFASRCLLLGVSTLLSGAILAGATAESAEAHAAFLESKPPPGARLTAGPRTIRLEFTEPVNRRLTTATLTELPSGETIPTAVGAGAQGELLLRPAARLRRAAFRVNWHTVSTEDGHALEGSIAFGVGTAATGSSQELEQSPLARGGWLRIALRAFFYAGLFFFAGGVFCSILLSGGKAPGGWLVPESLGPALEQVGLDRALLAAQAWRRTLDAGWVAAAAAAATATAEAGDASGGLSLQGMADFLLSNIAGLGRVLVVLALVAAVLSATRLPLVGAGLSAVAFLAIAVSGHAKSAALWPVAVTTDWMHLLAGAIWIGGIGQIAATWLPSARRGSPELRRRLMGGVLRRFGTVALPAFLAVLATGSVNALIQLGSPEALWQTAYGRVLTAKIVLVALIGASSYGHAMRLRPRLLTANPHPPERLERRHWRLLGSEPAWAGAVLVVAAALVAFPLPPRQVAEADGAPRSGAPCDPCPLERPAATELAVAEQAGSSVVALWIRRTGGALEGTLRVLGREQKPVARATIVGAAPRSCGPGCWRFRFRGRPKEILVQVPEQGRIYTARLPTRWRANGNKRARRLLQGAQATMRRLKSVREVERTTSGPTGRAVVSYRLKAPDRLAYRTDLGAGSVSIGKRQWSRYDQGVPWQSGSLVEGGPAFRTRSWFRWTSYARAVRLLSVRRRRGRELAELALMDQGTPAWHRLTIDLKTLRVLRVRWITDSHFTSQRLFGFNKPVSIRPPIASPDGR